MADPAQIHQVVMNLCTNAHHAMKEKGGVLDVRLASWVLDRKQATVHPHLEPGPYVKVTVKDTGPGMDKTITDKIFDPYFTTKEKGVGTGLGLAIVHGIVEKHGGAITLESEPGKGASFEILFPSIEQKEILKSPKREEIPGGHEHILLIDDEQVLVDLGRQMLERLGYTVETQISSIDALALFRAEPSRFDLVITDMTMPDMTGERLAMELMRIQPDIPVILCTGYSETDLEERAGNIGIRALVMKPVVISELSKSIRMALAGKEDDLDRT
jgi:CheY-like chemotaxis protein